MPSDSASFVLLKPPWVMKAGGLLEHRDLRDVSLDPDVRRRGAESGRVLVATDRRHDLDRLPRHRFEDRLEHAGFRVSDRPEAGERPAADRAARRARPDATPGATAGWRSG